MDYQAFVDLVSVPCAVLSVQKVPGGEIRIVASNQQYKDVMGPKYYDNMLYSELVPKDLKYEDYCYRAAVLGQRMHAYVETRALECWTDQQMIPLASDREDVGYCQFLFEFTKNAEAERMTGVSADVAAAVIQCGLTLMGTNDLQDGIRVVAGKIMEFSGAKNCRIMLIDDEAKQAVNFCELFAPGELEKRALISYDIAKTWEQMIGVSNGVIVKDAREMDDLERRNPEWVREMRNYGVTSLVMVPMRREMRIIGYIYIINFDTDNVVKIKELMETLSFIIGAEVTNYTLMRKLEELSTRDELTGVGNRNALRLLMEKLIANPNALPMGVVYMDVNGLKIVNDRNGHDAGDILLRHAVQMMERAFQHNTLYRAGGDEFVAVVENCSKAEFDRRVAHFKQIEVSDPVINIAVGAQWADSNTQDVRSVFREADEQMYADKRLFYLRNPEMNRRKR